MAFTPRDFKDVSALVSKKLELYMNHERREDRFDTQGRYRTTPKMETLDLMCHMLDKADLKKTEMRSSKSGSLHKDNRSRKSKKRIKSTHNDESSTDIRNGYEENKSVSTKHSKEKKEKKSIITPCLIHNSRRVVPVGEAQRLTQTANKIFEEQDLDKLHVIHRYRPHSPDIAAITENGKVANYVLHVGSALHSKQYVDYYLKEGLQSSKREYAKRLQRLQAKKEGESDHGKKGSHDTPSSGGQNHKSVPLLRMQEILSPCQSIDSLSSSRSSTPRKLNPLTFEQPVYNAFTKIESQSSRASSEKQPKASSHLYKAKRYASGYGYRIVAKNENNIESLNYQNLEWESRADIASSEDYCKFSASPAEIQKSGREDFGFEVEGKKVLELTDVKVEYNKYKSSVDSVSLSKEKEFVDTRAQSHNESYTSESHLSVRSTMSKFSPQSKDLDNSYISIHSIVSGHSGTYCTEESDLYNSTQSEQHLDTARSVSLLSSTPRRPKIKSLKREPIQTIINPPEIPRLGIPSDVNETTEKASSLNSSALEEYVTAEAKALKHPDARALEERIISSHVCAKDKTLDDDSRAEISIHKYLASDEISDEPAVEPSLPPLDQVVSINADECEKDETIREQKNNEEDKTDSKNSCKQDNGTENKEQMEKNEDAHESSVVYQGSVIDCKEGSSLKRDVRNQRRVNKLEGTDVERGEDELKNMELHRGEVPTPEKDKPKVKPERGDDTPRTMATKGRLTKSAKRRGTSNYYTMGDNERGLEKEYFEPLNENEKEEYIPSIEPENGSELNTPASSRPSSGLSASSDGTLQSADRRRKEKPNIPASDRKNKEEGKGEQSRPQSVVNKSFDGRGDDSNSVKNHSCPESTLGEKETKKSNNDEGLDHENVFKSLCSQSSFRADAQNDKMQVSSGSRGSITTKERLGTGRGYSIEGEMLARGQDENYDRKVHDSVKVKNEQEKEFQHYMALEKRSSSNEQPTTQENEGEADPHTAAIEPSKAESHVGEDHDLKEDPEQMKDGDSTINNMKVNNQSEKIHNASIESSNVIKNYEDPIIEKNLSSGCLKKNMIEESSTTKEDRFTPEQGTTLGNKQSNDSANQNLPLEEKAFIETYSDENEVIKEAISASASLVISDGDTVIDFRPLSASTAISVRNDNVPDRRRLSLPQPSKIVEVTEIDSNMGSGRESHCVGQDPPILHPAERKHSKDKENKMHVVNIADVKLESYGHINEHPAMKRSTSEYLSTKVQRNQGLKSQRNLSLPLDQAKDRYLPASTISSNEEKQAFDKREGKIDADLEYTIQMPQKNVVAYDSEKKEEEYYSEAIISEEKHDKHKNESEQENVLKKNLSKIEEGQDKSQSEKDKVDKVTEKSGIEQDKVIDNCESEQDKESDKSASKHENVIEKSGTEQDVVIEKSETEQSVMIEKSVSQQDKGVERTTLEQDKVSDKNELEQDKVVKKSTSGQNKVVEKNTLEQDKVVEKNKLEPNKVIKKGISKQDKVIEKSTSEQDKVIEKRTSEQDKVIEKSAPEQGKVIEKNASEQDKVIEKSTSEQDKVIEKSTSEQDTVVEKSASEQDKVMDKCVSEQENVTEKNVLEQENVTERSKSEQNKTIEINLSTLDRVVEKSASEQDKAIEKSASEQDKAIEKFASEPDKAIEKSASEQDRAIEKSASEHNRAIEKAASEQDKAIDISESEKDFIEKSEREQDSVTEISKQEKVLDKSGIEQEKVMDKTESEQDKVIKKNASEQDKIIEKSSSEQDKIVEKSASEQNNLVKRSESKQAKAIEKSASEQEDKIVKKSASEQDKIRGKNSSEEDKVTEKSASEQDKIVEGSLLKQGKNVMEGSDSVVTKDVSYQDKKIEKYGLDENNMIERSGPEPNKSIDKRRSEKGNVVEKEIQFEINMSEQKKVTENIESEQVNETRQYEQTNISPNQENCLKKPQMSKQKHILLESDDIIQAKEPLSDLDKFKEWALSEEEKSMPQLPSKQETKREESQSVQQKLMEQSFSQQEKLTQDHPCESEKMTEQVPLEKDEMIELSHYKPGKAVELFPPEYEPEKIIVQPQPDLGKEIELIQLEHTKVTEQLPLVPEQWIEPTSSVIEKQIKQPQPQPDPEKETKLGLLQLENVSEKTQPEQEKMRERYLIEQEILTEKERVAEQPSSELENVIEPPACEEGKLTQRSPANQEKVVEDTQSGHDKMTEKPSSEKENVVEKTPTELEKVTTQHPFKSHEASEQSQPAPEKGDGMTVFIGQ